MSLHFRFLHTKYAVCEPIQVHKHAISPPTHPYTLYRTYLVSPPHRIRSARCPAQFILSLCFLSTTPRACRILRSGKLTSVNYQAINTPAHCSLIPATHPQQYMLLEDLTPDSRTHYVCRVRQGFVSKLKSCCFAVRRCIICDSSARCVRRALAHFEPFRLHSVHYVSSSGPV